MTSIFVAKLDFGIGNEELRQAFARYGTVLKATVATDRETGKSRGFGFVEMANEEEAKQAISALDGSLLNGRPIAVKEAEQRNDNRGPRESFNRDSNRAPRENQPRADRPPREDAGRPPVGEASQSFAAPFDPVKPEPKRKKEEKKSKSWDEDKGAKKPKMNAYKKTNKHSRFFDDDEDDDFDLDQFNSYYSANEDDLDDSEDEFEDED